MAKRYEELTIADDFMFGKVMEDKKLCREVLECLLEQPVGELEDVQTERQFRYTTNGKPIRLDVYTRTEYMKELLHDDNARVAERSSLLTLIPRMTAGGDEDKIVQLENPKVLEAMQRKYGLNFTTLPDSGKK